LKKFVKVRQALEVPPPDPSWPPAAGGSSPRPPPPCDLTHTYCTATNVLSLSHFLMKVSRGKF